MGWCAYMWLMAVELTDEEATALVRLLREAIDSDRFPLSPRVQVLRAILARLRPEPARPAASPEQRAYAPPSRGRYAKRGVQGRWTGLSILTT